MHLLLSAPLLVLLLLYHLAPHHFPPSTTTTRLFVLYALTTQLIIHRARLFSLCLRLISYILIAAIYLLHYLANAAHFAQSALVEIYVEVSRYIEGLAARLAQQRAHVQVSCGCEEHNHDFSTRQDSSSFSSSSSSSPSFTCDGLDDDDDDDEPNEILQFLQDSTAPFLTCFYAVTTRLQNSVQNAVSCIYNVLLPPCCTIAAVYNQIARDLHITRIRLALLVKRTAQPLSRIPSGLVRLAHLYYPAMALFTLHFVVCAIMLSMGEVYALGTCLLSLFWMLSWLG